MGAGPIISLKEVSISMHGHRLFEYLDWDIRTRENWVVIGPNGSGRSSLVKAIAGLLPITKGTISRDSENIEYVSFETQKTLLPHETFLQDRWNVGLAEKGLLVSDLLPERGIEHANPFVIPILSSRAKYRDSGFEKRRQDIIRQFGSRSLLKRKMIELSNGERRKIMIARALLRKPSLLILDNPFEGLDEQFRKKLSKILTRTMREKVQLILVGTPRDPIPSGITHVLLISAEGIKQGRLETMRPKLLGTKKNKTLPKRIPRSTSKEEALVEMKKVNVSYGDRHILHNLNWTVREHERWALFGPNGAGKTTLLSLILADNPQAYANDITLFGKKRGSGESIWEIKRQIGSVSPELQLYFPSTSSGQAPAEVTCLDVVCSGWFDSIGLYRECTEDQREIALAMMQEFGIAELVGELFENVSEGEQRLTLLARAMVKSPRLLVLDEPCQGLDPEHRDRVLKAIDSIEENSTTIIYVTHRTDELPGSITDILRLKKES